MISKEVLTKIKEIEIQTRRLLSGMLVGDSTSAVKGSGFEFDQIREYAQGDDVRFIDWHSSARTNSLLVKQFMEERSRTVLLVVDSSSSMFFSSTDHLKYDIAAQIASILGLVAEYGKDHVGLYLFGDTVQKAIAPKRGSNHMRAIMHTLFSQGDTQQLSRSGVVCDAIAQQKKSDAIVFFISDFLHDIDEKKMAILARKHDVIAIRCLDQYEKQLPTVGALNTVDALHNNALGLLLQRRSTRKINQFLQERINAQTQLFRKYGIDVLDVSTDRSFIADLVRFFRKRMMY